MLLPFPLLQQTFILLIINIIWQISFFLPFSLIHYHSISSIIIHSFISSPPSGTHFLLDYYRRCCRCCCFWTVVNYYSPLHRHRHCHCHRRRHYISPVHCFISSPKRNELLDYYRRCRCCFLMVDCYYSPLYRHHRYQYKDKMIPYFLFWERKWN